MNKFILIVLGIFLTYTGVDAQQHLRGRQFGFGGRNKIQQLEKLKLIEVLDMDEETSVRFFTRRKNHMENQRELASQREAVLVEIEEIIRDDSGEKSESLCKSKMAEVFEIEKKMVDERASFFDSLNDILAIEQVATVLAFEVKFKKEIWNSLMHKPRKRELMD